MSNSTIHGENPKLDASRRGKKGLNSSPDENARRVPRSGEEGEETAA